jgi:hypothetical protein
VSVVRITGAQAVAVPSMMARDQAAFLRIVVHRGDQHDGIVDDDPDHPDHPHDREHRQRHAPEVVAVERADRPKGMIAMTTMGLVQLENTQASVR